MDCAKVGRLIFRLRKEKGLTQRQLAERLGISNKTISKWECGGGAPDVSLWDALSDALGADVLKLLRGELQPNRPDVGKIDRVRFYVCPACGNILTSTGRANISCCGRRLAVLAASAGDGEHAPSVEDMDLETYVRIRHEMSKEHYLSFAAYVDDHRIWFQRLYPEQSPDFRMPAMGRRGALYLYCVRHGLYRYSVKELRRG